MGPPVPFPPLAWATSHEGQVQLGATWERPVLHGPDLGQCFPHSWREGAPENQSSFSTQGHWSHLGGELCMCNLTKSLAVNSCERATIITTYKDEETAVQKASNLLEIT